MKILRCSFVSHCMTNCLKSHYIPLSPENCGWKWCENDLKWDPVWYEGEALPDFDEMNVNLEQELQEGEERVEEVVDEDESGESDEDSDDDSDYVKSADESNVDSDEDY